MPNKITCQTYTFSPGKNYVFNLDTNASDFGGIEILNTGSQNLDLTWKQILTDTLVDSRFELCNSGICFLNLPHSGIMPTIAPNDKGWIKFHMYSGITTGTNTIKYIVKRGSIQIDTLTFQIIVSTPTAISETNFSMGDVLLFPNPAKNETTLTFDLLQNETINIRVMDVMCRETYHETINNSAAGNHTIHLNTGNWANGVYDIHVSTSGGTTSRKLVISK
ncbi:MAG: hypothetical protein K0S53_2583 [Bacteroidetes bacterium]|nr:hypothetical protein [Bacteroidota bacterium]MDF2450967.1 hypothetical protein [Bacteroidota bacterium]